MALVYTFATATTEVLRRCGGRNDPTTFKRATDWLNTAMVRLAKSDLEFPGLETTEEPFNVVSGQSEYSFPYPDVGPDDVIGIRHIRNQTSGFGMTRFPWRDYRMIGTQASGAPIRWTRRGSTLAFDPQPDDTYELLVDYRRRPRADTLDDFNSEWHDIIVQIATWIGWTALDNPQMAGAAMLILPAHVQRALQIPMGQDEWEAMSDDDVGFEPRRSY